MWGQKNKGGWCCCDNEAFPCRLDEKDGLGDSAQSSQLCPQYAPHCVSQRLPVCPRPLPSWELKAIMKVNSSRSQKTLHYPLSPNTTFALLPNTLNLLKFSKMGPISRPASFLPDISLPIGLLMAKREKWEQLHFLSLWETEDYSDLAANVPPLLTSI